MKKIIIIGIALAIIGWIGSKINPKSNDYSNSKSSNNKAHTCTWCNKSYSGSGYHHIGNSCEMASNGWEKYDNKCSTKCCEEAWNNGKH